MKKASIILAISVVCLLLGIVSANAVHVLPTCCQDNTDAHLLLLARGGPGGGGPGGGCGPGLALIHI